MPAPSFRLFQIVSFQICATEPFTAAGLPGYLGNLIQLPRRSGGKNDLKIILALNHDRTESNISPKP